jgi:glycosyltransferase involved in cell wall biosynthesis
MSASPHLLLTADAVGGVWQYALDLAAAFAPFGYRVTLATLGPAPSPDQRARAAAVPGLTLIETGLALEWLADDPAQMRQAEHTLARLAADVAADIVQLHSPALAAGETWPCPVVAVLHSCVATWWSAVREGPMPPDFRWRTDLVRAGLRRAALAVAPSAAFAAAAQRHYGVLPLPVHNGRAFAAPPAAMQDRVFTAGRLWDEGKNVATLDRAARRLAVPFDAAGPDRAPHGQGIALDALHPLGTLDEATLARHLSARPVFASAALYEPFGLSVLEAAASGCALVLSDIPTFRELWGGAATFVPPRDDAAFAAAITALIEDSATRIAAGERARARAARYRPAAIAARLAGLYAHERQRAAA